MENWIETDFDGSSLTPEEQESFKQAMGKYKSKDEALIGGYNAIKLTGKPFKLPESLDKLDDNVRKEFTTQARKVLKIEDPVTEDTIKQVNYKKGLAEGKEANELVKTKLSEFAVKEGISLTKVQNLVEFVNQFGTELTSTADAEQQKAIKDAIDNTGKVLDLYYGPDNRKANAELLRKAVINNCGLSKEESDQLADDLADNGYIFQKPALAKVLMDKIAPLAKEGDTTSKGQQQTKTQKRTLADEGLGKIAEKLKLE